ncbi:MAG: TIR domain-containing protein [Alphaproteobacteria bacterium]|jgi:hypothetical protein|nr:TIR domain-containing protein [Alphaproteobacteria bacterium]
MIDYMPDGEDLALMLEGRLAEFGEVYLSIRDILRSVLHGTDLNEIVDKTDWFIVIWSAQAEALGEQVSYSRSKAKELYDVGPEKFIVFNPENRRLPLIMSDLPAAQTLDHVKRFVQQGGDRDNRSGSQRIDAAGQIFLSYSSKNYECADELCRILGEDHQVWRDTTGMGGPSAYGTQILRAISECSGLLLLLTEESAASPHCLREVYAAVENNKRIFVISEVTRDNIQEDWHYPLLSLHINEFDCRKINREQILRVLENAQ